MPLRGTGEAPMALRGEPLDSLAGEALVVGRAGPSQAEPVREIPGILYMYSVILS